jgi:hypothetical protein
MGRRFAVLTAVLSAGCAASVGDRPADPLPTPVAVAGPTPSPFASLRPGDFVPAHPHLPADPPPAPADPPPVPPALRPATVPVAAAAPAESPLTAAVRHLEAGRPHDAEVALAALPAGGRALPVLATAVQLAAGGSVADLVRTLDGLSANLAPQAPLEVTRAALCRDVKGFARFDPLPDRPTLPAHKRPTVWVYLELRNVAPRPAGGDKFVVRLNRSLVVQDAAGAVVDQYAEPPDPLELRGPRRDNFAALWFRAPAAPGEYSVTLRVQEPAADGRGTSREAVKKLGFTVK